MFQEGAVEVEYQARLQSGDSQVGKHLCGVNRIKTFDALDFNDYAVRNYQIRAVFGNECALVIERNPDLTGEAESSRGEFDANRGFINGFEKTRPEVFVDLDGTTHDLVGDGDVMTQ